jgi:hypothetical protein
MNIWEALASMVKDLAATQKPTHAVLVVLIVVAGIIVTSANIANVSVKTLKPQIEKKAVQ